jgi:hypothetical protein
MLCVCVCIPLIVARHRLSKHLPAATDTHAIKEEIFGLVFSNAIPVLSKENMRLVPPSTSCHMCRKICYLFNIILSS